MTVYDTDFVNWTKQQVALLRSMPNTDKLDIVNLVDEIEGLGRAALADFSNAIRQLLSTLIRRSIEPSSTTIEDIYSVQADAIIRANGGVWSHVDLDKVWRLAKRSVDVELPDTCPITIEQLIVEDFDVDQALLLIRP